MPDSAFQLAGRQLFRADRNQLSGKARGGGLCVYINQELILQDAAEAEQPVPLVDEEEQEDFLEGLFAAYHKRQKKDIGTTAALQLSHYFDIAEGQNALLFWALNMKTFPSLFKVALRVFSVPASSAPVERVFSHGSIIVRPHRAQITDRRLANLVFCKCNTA